MTEPAIGRLERVNLRNIWATEASDFTPWLARPENLSVLGESLGISLELEAQERSVGPFRADILCKDINTNHWVLIENQLEKTDHGHLGQLLTYASGLNAVTIVWISAQFTEEHRSTLDWLNRITDSSVRFFGVEVELFRISNSPVAPRFNIVSKPNDWSHSISQAARAIDESELSDVRLLQIQYWDNLNSVLNEHQGPIAGNKKPQPQSWMGYPIGRSNFYIGAVMVRTKRQIRAELYITGSSAKNNFRTLKEQRDEIEKELGYRLDWDELKEGQDCRISSCLGDADPEDREDWRRQHEWLTQKLNELHRVFFQRVRSIGK